MKNSLTYLVFCILLLGCSLPKYNISYKSPKGLNFKESKFILAPVKSNSFINQDGYYDYLLSEFKSMGGDNVQSVYSITDLPFTPQKLTDNIDPLVLNMLSKTTEFNSIIQVIINYGKDEMNDVMIVPNKEDKKSESSVEFKVIDVKTGRMTYSQTISGEVFKQGGNEDLYFGKSSSGLASKSIKKGFEEIREYAILF